MFFHHAVIESAKKAHVFVRFFAKIQAVVR